MATQPQSSARLVFGPFELNVRDGELRKRGVLVRLPRQPLQTLLLLLANPGAVVTRERLREQLWSDGTFVDFERGLNSAINKLRRALSDSADNPRYIETVPGRGYRFIGPLQEESVSQSTPSELSPTPVLVQMSAPSAEVVKSRPWRKSWPIAIATTLLTFFAAAYYFLHRPPPRLTDKDQIVLADFENTTGEPVFDGTLRQGLAVQLEQSPFLSLISESRIQQTLHLMGRPADAGLTPALAREVCERTASAAVLEGSIARLGSRYVLGLRANNCRTGEVLDEEQVQAARKEDVLNALSQIGSKFRTRVGESLATIKKHDTPLAEATTPSLEALKAYSAARKVAFSRGDAAALPLFKRAVEIDPRFAMAHAYLARIYGDIGESVLSAESATRAYQLRDRASDPEKFYIAFTYDQQVTGNLEKVQETGELWAQTYPRDLGAYGPISGFVYQGSGKYEKSINAAKIAIGLDPDFAFGYAQSRLYLFLPGPPGRGREHPSASCPAKTGNPRFFGPPILHRVFKG